jgi:hypothetical protein
MNCELATKNMHFGVGIKQRYRDKRIAVLNHFGLGYSPT